MVGSKQITSSRAKLLLGLLAAGLALVATFASAATAAAAESPEWRISAFTSPGHLAPEGTGEVRVVAVNVGDGTTNGTPITVEDHLPTGLTATAVTGVDIYANGPDGVVYPAVVIQHTAAKMACTVGATVVCTTSDAMPIGDQLNLRIKVKVAAGAPASMVDDASVSGGGAAEASIESPVTVSTEPAPAGLAPGSVLYGTGSKEAGAHASVTTGFALNTLAPNITSGDPKDIRFSLPPGAVGNTVGIPRCPMAQVALEDCPADTIVGVATIELKVATLILVSLLPVYNIAPSSGEPAAFAIPYTKFDTRLDTSVLSNGNDSVRVTAGNVEQNEPIFGSYITIWGVPAEHEGPGEIGSLIGDTKGGVSTVGGVGSATPVPLLTNPTQCAQSLTAVAEVDAWRNPGVFQSVEVPAGTMSGCLEVPFGSEFSFLPDTLEAGAPAGYEFSLRVPQVNSVGTRATSNVRDVSLTLPEGVVVNPSAAWGLKACSASEFFGPDHPSQTPAAEAQCPRESEVGKVWIKSPALEEALEGEVFLAEPTCSGPCTPKDAEEGRMVRLYIQAVSEGEGGIVIKLEGYGRIDQETGRITTVFEENPQLPFSEFKLKLAGGPRAVLANPRTCGPVKTEGDLQPWSSLQGEGEAKLVNDSTPTFEFEIDQNCFGPEFHPSFKAGMPNVEAGENSEFTLAFGRLDSSEMLKSISIHTPEGLMGSLTGIPLCKEAEANAGTCSQESLLGSAEVLTGPGADPFLVEGGKVYLTEGYGGAPFGLSVVVPAVAGPYTLAGTTGKGTVVVRAQIFVDPHTAELTIVSGEMPSMLDGIPLQLKAVNVRINRPHFMFNPTSCEKMAITGTIDAVEGMTANVSSPFQVTNCARLPFEPTLTAATLSKHTRANGASLHVTVTSGAGQANVHEVHVELPKQLPSELKTLQRACTEAQFNANPAGCPSESVIGTAEVHTPVLPVPLTGPAYFVSHGGAQFPELVMVLQGYGVTVQLNGETFISKAGITSSTFKTVPDVPFERFDLTLPTGKYSALAGNGDFCAENLRMPTRIVGQSGKVVEQNTQVQVEGCPGNLALRKHSIKGRTLTLKVYAPSAGTIKATGKGLVAQTKKPGARGTVTLTLHEQHAGALKTDVHVIFTPTSGKSRKRQAKSLSVRFH
ncbi:MAG TPA: hypothetical protein VGF95_00140 [Solirubrobacteraceae bacterium]|jgi:hypothetical protein